MRPIQAITTCLRKSFQFSGRASRSEFWWFTLFIMFGMMALMVGGDVALLGFDANTPTAFMRLSDSFGLATLPASMANTMGRMHDLTLPGWPAALALFMAYAMSYAARSFALNRSSVFENVEYTLLVINLLCRVLAARPSQPGPNRYGPNPLEVTP